MEKRIVEVAKRTVNFKCSVCKHTVEVNKGTPKVIETEDSIIRGWEYGHEHKRVFHIINKKAYIVEGY